MKSKLAACLFLLIATNVRALETAKSWNEWMAEGATLRGAGQYTGATAALLQALKIAERSGQVDAPLIQTLDALAAVNVDAGRLAEAEHLYQRALTAVDVLQGRKSLTYAVLLASLATISEPVASSEETLAELREAITVYQHNGSASSVNTVRDCLAEILINRKEYREAEGLLLDARADLCERKPADPVLLFTVLNNLAHLRYEQARFADALDSYLESTSILRSQLGAEHQTMVPALNNLALDYFQLGRLDEADRTFKQAAALCNGLLANHPACGNVFENYAGVLRKLKRKGEAKKLAARSQQFRQESARVNGVGMTVSVSALRSEKN